MNRKASKKIQVKTESLAALLLLIVLAGFTSLLIAETGGSYRRLVGTSDVSQNIRTSLCFVATELRTSGGQASVRRYGGHSAVVIAEKSGGQPYEDWIFYYKNTLREVLVPAGTKITPGSCQIISHIRSFDAREEGGVLRITVEASSGSQTAAQSITLAQRA